jgi:hypothetical protein
MSTVKTIHTLFKNTINYTLFKDTNIIKTFYIYNESKELHSENDIPAFIVVNDTSKKNYIKEWYLNGKLHRDNGPARITHSCYGFNIKEEWYYHGELHRENNQPTIYTKIYFDNANINSETWYLNGKLHRLDGPARVLYYQYSNNVVEYETYYQYGKMHRSDGPCHIQYFNIDNNKVKKIKKVIYKENDKLRSNEPSVIYYSYNNSTCEECYYENEQHTYTKVYENNNHVHTKVYVDGINTHVEFYENEHHTHTVWYYLKL